MLSRFGLGLGGVTGGGRPADIITSIFADGTDGFYYNFSTLTKLWKDTSATTQVAAAGDNIARSDDTSPRGRNATQATTAAQPKYQTGGLARFDGLDDNLLTTLNPSSPFTMVVKLKAGSATRGIMGITTGTNGRCFLQTATSGLLCGGVGANSTGVIVGGASILGAIGVAALTLDGTTNKLYWNGGEIYSGVQNGTPGAFPIALGAVNSSGTVTAFGDHDFYHALAIKKALTAAQVAAITNLWGTS